MAGAAPVKSHSWDRPTVRRVTQRRANYSVWTVDQTLRLREGMHQEEKEGGWGALGVRGMGPFVLRLGQLFAGPMLPCT